MERRGWIVASAAAAAITMGGMSIAWACGNMTTADMTIKNATDEAYDGPGSADVGKNWSDCPIGRWLYVDNAQTQTTPGHRCERSVTVAGQNFVNSDGVAITTVELYWLDEPFYAAGLGGPNGAPEQTFAELCRTKGVHLGSATVGTDKKFTATVNAVPQATQYADTTPRAGGKFYYGLNAICAVWWHPTGATGHWAAVGNQYSVYP